MRLESLPVGTRYALSPDGGEVSTLKWKGEGGAIIADQDGRLSKAHLKTPVYPVPVAKEPPPFEPVRVGEIQAGEFWGNDDVAWRAWVDQVMTAADEYGAWFVVGVAPNGDRWVIDTLRKRLELCVLFSRLNIRSASFWRSSS